MDEYSNVQGSSNVEAWKVKYENHRVKNPGKDIGVGLFEQNKTNKNDVSPLPLTGTIGVSSL